MSENDQRALLRHTLATVAYRGAKALRGAPPTFAAFRAGPTTRTPGQILGHMGDLLEWAVSMAKGKQAWREEAPGPWDAQSERFFRLLGELDRYLASDAPLGTTPQRLFQGPVADALTHIGQLAMLRRLADAPVRGENYFVAEIVAGVLGPDQAAPRREFE
jgi:hypothetical protein